MEEIIDTEGLTYEKAMAELNTLVEKTALEGASFEQIEKDVKRAMELIKFCKEELNGYKERFEKLQNA